LTADICSSGFDQRIIDTVDDFQTGGVDDPAFGDVSLSTVAIVLNADRTRKALDLASASEPLSRCRRIKMPVIHSKP
jgi:hypothetical protein